MATEMLAGDVPDKNKVRSVMAGNKPSKFKAAFMKKFADNPKDSPAKEAAEKKAGKAT